MKISVVTISYNQSEYLRECLDSVLGQDYPSFEYIVVDPGSDDGSRDIIAEYGRDIDYAILTPDEGPADGLAKGFKKASGDIFYYLNADDVVLPGTFSYAADFFKRYGDVDVLLGRGLEIDGCGKVSRKLFPSRKWTLRKRAAGVANAVQQSTFFRRSAYLNAGGFNTRNYTCWDGELLVDMMLSGANVMSRKKCLGCFRVYPSSITGSGRLENRYKMDLSRINNKISDSPHFSELTPLQKNASLAVDFLCDPCRLVEKLTSIIFSERNLRDKK